MSDPAKTQTTRYARLHRPPPRAVIGLEAEFKLLVNDVHRRPEEVFGTPQGLVREQMLPRTGRSFQLPAGGAIYFDTGVIEVATPIVELEAGCCFRATRLLWEQICYVRAELDRWSVRNDCSARLQGFSTHYNVSFRAGKNAVEQTANQFGYLLVHILSAPLMLLAANRKSSAIGVRPRSNRIEVTADFTPDAALTLAACAFVAGVAETARSWSRYDIGQLAEQGIPRLVPFGLRKHSSRKGWRVLARSLAHDPFTSDPNAAQWKVRDERTLSLREIAAETLRPFRREIRSLSDLATLRHIEAVFRGDARSLLDFPTRPKAYDDAGRAFDWNRRRVRHWPRSAYERVIHRVIAREPIHIGGKRYVAQRMQGWYEVVCRESKTGRRRVFTLDELAKWAATHKRHR
ncbi:MAG: hypothetical protein ACR2MF_03285 [Chthoniobacterales bacterium]